MGVLHFTPMRLLSPFVLFGALSACTLAVADEARLQVKVTPSSSALKSNIEGYVGSLGERDAAALEQYRKTVQTLAAQAAQALGYYQAQISSEILPMSPPTLRLNVERGEPVRLREVEIRVEGPAASQGNFRLPSNKQLKPGARLDHGAYDEAKRSIQSQAARFGYFQGQFSQQQLLIDPVDAHADIHLVFVSGPRYRLGEVGFTGDTLLDEDLLRRMLPFKTGAEYDSEHIAELYQVLQSSGYFSRVRIDAEPATAQDGVIPLQVDLALREPRTLGLGLGFSTDVGPRARFNWTRHWANAQGHSYGLESELSAPRRNIGLWFDIPGAAPLTDKLRFAGGYQYEEIADTDSLSELLTLGPEWHSRRASGWQRVISLKWQREEYRLGDDSGLSTLLMPGISYSLLRSDNRIDPNRGYRLQFEARAAKSGLLSDADVLYGNALLKGLTTVWDKHRLLGRAQVGATFSGGYSKVPPSLRFFAGGDQSVRGYDYQSLSPQNNREERVGGRYLLAGSLEYQYAIADKWRIAAFVDKGGAFNTPSVSALKAGVGVGVRWVSPVGPLRLDLANGLDEDGGVRLHFSMGPEL
jgi:translocation and assembly module TamA